MGVYKLSIKYDNAIKYLIYIYLIYLKEARAVSLFLFEPDAWILEETHSSDMDTLFSVRTPVDFIVLQIAQPGSKQKHD